MYSFLRLKKPMSSQRISVNWIQSQRDSKSTSFKLTSLVMDSLSSYLSKKDKEKKKQSKDFWSELQYYAPRNTEELDKWIDSCRDFTTGIDLVHCEKLIYWTPRKFPNVGFDLAISKKFHSSILNISSLYK